MLSYKLLNIFAIYHLKVLCETHCISNLKCVSPQALCIYVERVPSAARFLQDTTGRVPLQVIWGTRDPNRIKFSVDLDSVYETSQGTKVYELSRVKGVERNIFRVVVVMVFVDGNTKEFVSKSFQVRSRRTLKGTFMFSVLSSFFYHA